MGDTPNLPTIPASSPVPFWVPYSIGFVLLMFFGMGMFMAYKNHDTQQLGQYQIALVAMVSSGVVGFYFGSNSGSQKKDDVLAANTAQLANSVPASSQDAEASKTAQDAIAANPVPHE
jgi:hypothetical protein